MITLHEKSIKYLEKYPKLDWDSALWKAFESNQNLIYQKNTRLNQRVKNIVENENAVFYTLTISNDHIDKKETTLRRYAIKWCKDHLVRYVGNSDYGKEKGRLHFHVIGNYNELPSNETWKYGAINFKRVNTNYKALVRYINKLTNHALKNTAHKIWRSKEK